MITTRGETLHKNPSDVGYLKKNRCSNFREKKTVQMVNQNFRDEQISMEKIRF